MVGLHDQQPPPVDSAVPKVYIKAVCGFAGVVPELHIVGGVGFQVVAVELQVVHNDPGKEPPLRGHGVFRGKHIIHLGGLGQHHEPVVVDVHRVFQKLRPRLAQLLQRHALKDQLIQELLLLPAPGEQGHGPVQHLRIRQAGHGDMVRGPGDGGLADAGIGIPREIGSVLLPDQVENVFAHGQTAAENTDIQIGFSAAGIVDRALRKHLGHHGKIGVHMGEGVLLHG